jgi:flagellar motor switch protein FliN
MIRALSEDDSPLAEFAAELTPPADGSTMGQEPSRRAPAGASIDVDAQIDTSRNPDFIMRIPVTLRIVIGSATMSVSALSKLSKGALIPLDRKIGEPVDVLVNGRVVARGEIVVADETSSRFGIKLTEVGTIAEQGR